VTPEEKLSTAIREARLEGDLDVAIKANLLQTMRKQRGRRLWPVLMGGAIAAGLAVLLAIPRSSQTPVHKAELHPAARAAETPGPVAEMLAEEHAAPVPVRRKARRAPAAPTAQVVATPFFALDAGVVGEPPSGYLMRVKVPRATMASFGLPVNQDLLDQRVDADVLFGNDGNARAIRFVRAVQ
jgi:hypothetical protein